MTMTRGQKQEEVRLEIIKLREQINAANNQLPGQGTVDLPALVQKEAELTSSDNEKANVITDLM